MPVVSIPLLKTYFEDGKEPDENKFIDLIDTLGISFSEYSAHNIFHTAWLNFPGIVGIWNTHYTRSHVNTHPNLVPVASPAPSLGLTGSGGITRNRYHGVPTLAFASGVSRYLYRTDVTTLSFTGDEGNVSVLDRGMAVGGWFYFNDTGSWGVDSQGLITKWGAIGNKSYLLYLDAAKRLRFYGSDNGTAYQNAAASVDIVPQKWYFIVGKFRTSLGQLEIYINGNEYTTVTGYTTIYDGTASFLVGAYASPISGFFDGRASGVFACGMYAPISILDAYYNQTSIIFEEQGVLGDPP